MVAEQYRCSSSLSSFAASSSFCVLNFAPAAPAAFAFAVVVVVVVVSDPTMSNLFSVSYFFCCVASLLLFLTRHY